MLAFGIDKDDLGKITITVLGAKLQTNDQALGEIVLAEDDTPSEYEAAIGNMFPEVEEIKKLSVRRKVRWKISNLMSE